MYERSFGPDHRFGHDTIAACARLGWLEPIKVEGDGFYSAGSDTRYLVLSVDGTAALGRLTDVDFEVQTNKPSVAGEAARVLRALAARHPWPEWIFLPEAPVYVGRPPGVVHVDALALSCWFTKGYPLVGYEVKVSRSDFKTELRKPEKTALSASMCSAFYFAAPHGLLRPEEIPAPYGLVVVFDSGRSRIVKRCKLERPEPTWGFVATLARRIVGQETAGEERT